ncbi:unnamed protein product [Ectocarpus sp. CCAP 1310/34]|nr:unnamed protein product [Ectocarpus sp. CCAP 1310/34]
MPCPRLSFWLPHLPPKNVRSTDDPGCATSDPALQEVKLPPRSPAALRLQTPDGRTLHPRRRRSAKRPNESNSPLTNALDGEERRSRQRRRRGIVGNAVKSSGEHVTVRVRRSIDVEVRRDYPVSEKAWTEFKAGCSVTYDQKIRVSGDV